MQFRPSCAGEKVLNDSRNHQVRMLYLGSRRRVAGCGERKGGIRKEGGRIEGKRESESESER